MTNEEIQKALIELNFPQPRTIRSTHKDLMDSILGNTRFLDNTKYNDNFALRVYCCFNSISSIPKCLNRDCENDACVSNNIKKFKYGKTSFGEFCSVRCMSKGVSNKRKQTSLTRYGVDHPSKSKSVIEKIKDTCKSRYGVEFVTQTNEFKEKTRQTSLEKYGTEHHSSSNEIIKKRETNNLEKYGKRNVFQLDSVKDKIKTSNIEKFGVDNPMKSEALKIKASNTSLERYGTNHPMQSDSLKRAISESNKERFKYGSFMREHYTDRCIEVLSNKELLQQIYDELGSTHEVARSLGLGSHKTVCMAMDNLGINKNKISTASVSEKELFNFVLSLGVDAKENDREILKPKEIDIVIESKKLCIEYNGMFWHSIQIKKDKNYHQSKVFGCLDAGYKLLHVYEDQWNDPLKKEIIKSKIRRFCGLEKDKIFARKCVVKEVGKEIYRDFYSKNHIQGSIDSGINYGLFHEGQIVSCISFKSLRDNCYDLTRYATSKVVPGGFSKLLNHFKKNHLDWKTIITFANLDYSVGDLYQKNGFEKLYTTGPNYFYYDGKQRFSRQTFMKNKLKNILEIYDPNLTEKENMKNNGFLTIYDSGSIKFITKNKNKYTKST